MTVLDGNVLAGIVKEKVKQERIESGLAVKLAVVLVGDDAASGIYVKSKEKGCAEVGFESVAHRLPSSTTQAELLSLIGELNADPSVNGILVQLPLPKHLDEKAVINTIDPMKDVDCFHPVNFGRLFAGDPLVAPCTPAGMMELLSYYKIPVAGKRAVIVGRSNIVGKPIAALLLAEHATVTICHSRTAELKERVKEADIVVAAIGKPEFIKGDWIKPGAVILDVGINRVEDASQPKGYRVVGDVDYEAASKVAAAITPVPGGVGKMTIAMLLDNTLKLAKYQKAAK